MYYSGENENYINKWISIMGNKNFGESRYGEWGFPETSSLIYARDFLGDHVGSYLVIAWISHFELFSSLNQISKQNKHKTAHPMNFYPWSLLFHP